MGCNCWPRCHGARLDLKFGSDTQKNLKQWLVPLFKGEIRSAYAVTEPGVASSDASNVSRRIEADGSGGCIVNGHNSWISGALQPECKIAIVLGKTRFDGPVRQQQSMILVPMDTPGVKILQLWRCSARLVAILR